MYVSSKKRRCHSYQNLKYTVQISAFFKVPKFCISIFLGFRLRHAFLIPKLRGIVISGILKIWVFRSLCVRLHNIAQITVNANLITDLYTARPFSRAGSFMLIHSLIHRIVLKVPPSPTLEYLFNIVNLDSK